MNYEQALELHESAKQYGSILGLESIQNLMHELQDVWKKLKIMHIAGTNGKGSVCCFLASVLKEAGYRAGQYNSPAVFDLREVYRINGEAISKESYADCMEQAEAACKRMTEKGMSHPTVFELETAIAFLWFYREKCDVVLLEAGMGGSTDATNLIQKPLCSVLVSVSMDHMNFLGDSLEEIAKVKSGIIKETCPVVTVEQEPVVEQIFRQCAEEKHSLYRKAVQVSSGWMEAGRLCYEHPVLGTLHLSLTGYYQLENSSLAVETLLLLRDLGYAMTDEQIRKGLEAARWPGRFECLSEQPKFYIDGAHNADAARKLKESLMIGFPNTKRIGIMGVMRDKSYGEMLDLLLPLFDKMHTVTPDNIRALSAEELAEEIKKRGRKAVAERSVGQAVRHACQEAAEESGDTMVIAFGSLYYLREVKSALHENTGNR